MLYFQMTPQGVCTGISETMPKEERETWTGRHKIESPQMADAIAFAASKFSGKVYTAVDEGDCFSPRYDVIEAPKVGDLVSYGFNGDYYPDGTITHVTKGTLRVVKTSTGGTYYRRGASSRWAKKGGTWSLVQGHRNERNPSF